MSSLGSSFYARYLKGARNSKEIRNSPCKFSLLLWYLYLPTYTNRRYLEGFLCIYGLKKFFYGQKVSNRFSIYRRPLEDILDIICWTKGHCKEPVKEMGSRNSSAYETSLGDLPYRKTLKVLHTCRTHKRYLGDPFEIPSYMQSCK